MADITLHHVHTIETMTAGWPFDGLRGVLEQLSATQARIERKVTDLMAYTEDELIGQIADARAAIGRIETDIQGLLDRERHLTVESREAMEALLGDLQAVDARVPDPAAEPPVEPPAEDPAPTPEAPAPEWGSAEAPMAEPASVEPPADSSGSGPSAADAVADPEPPAEEPPFPPAA